MTNDTLYLQIDQNVEVHNSDVTLSDIAKLECSNKNMESRIKTLKLLTLPGDNPGRYVVSVMSVISCIHDVYPSLEVNNIGEADFIITMEKEKHRHKAYSWLKAILVCFMTFFGAAFSIMTFNNDVSITKLFGEVYTMFTGQATDGFTILEFSYSIGVPVGIIIFFNHFAGKKLTSDPTPMQVEMRLYENDVNTTLIEASNRKESQ